jgi:hypothetical protein
MNFYPTTVLLFIALNAEPAMGGNPLFPREENAARLACIISSVAEKLSASFLTLRVAELLRVDDPRGDTDVPGLELIAREPLPQSLLRRTIPPLG